MDKIIKKDSYLKYQFQLKNLYQQKTKVIENFMFIVFFGIIVKKLIFSVLTQYNKDTIMRNFYIDTFCRKIMSIDRWVNLGKKNNIMSI